MGKETGSGGVELSFSELPKGLRKDHSVPSAPNGCIPVGTGVKQRRIGDVFSRGRRSLWTVIV